MFASGLTNVDDDEVGLGSVGMDILMMACNAATTHPLRASQIKSFCCVNVYQPKRVASEDGARAHRWA